MAQSGSSRFLTNRRSTRDGQILRLRGKGRPGIGGGPSGDALIEIEVRPHPIFTRNGDDIYVEIPISLKEAVLGGKVTVPTWTNIGRVLRLKGKGVPRPDGGRGDEHGPLNHPQQRLQDAG